MGSSSVTMAVFEGGEPGSKLEELLAGVRHAVLLDNLRKIVRVESVGKIILISNHRSLLAEAENLDRVVVHAVSAHDFHFGRELQNVVSRYKPDNLFYLGAASFPLLEEAEIREIASTVLSRENYVYTNNPQSSDLVAFTPARAVFNIEPPSSDNSLAMSLRDQAGLTMELVPNSRGIFFDLDTPTDYMILGAGPFAGRKVREALLALNFDYTLLEKAKEVLKGYYRDVAIIGRVGAPLIAHLNCNLKLRLRIFSEERGMKALGREAAGEVESLLGYLIDEAGIDVFFRYLEKVAELAFIDTRVLFAHHKLKPPAEERYFSDLLRWEHLNIPWLKEFTRAAAKSRIPVIMGGHSLVSGGLWVLAEEVKGERLGVGG